MEFIKPTGRTCRLEGFTKSNRSQLIRGLIELGATNIKLSRFFKKEPPEQVKEFLK